MRRGQEELVGFVAIMILLAVVFLVFLTFSLRTPQQDIRANTDVYYFLASSMETTTDCAQGFDNRFLSVAELLISCKRDQQCTDGRESCLVVNSTITELVQKGFNPGIDRPVSGYRLQIEYVQNISTGQGAGEFIMTTEQGVCGNSLRGASYSVPASPGLIITELQLCS